jgi:hypothetical protein
MLSASISGWRVRRVVSVIHPTHHADLLHALEKTCYSRARDLQPSRYPASGWRLEAARDLLGDEEAYHHMA